jgi:hypothetical protein
MHPREVRKCAIARRDPVQRKDVEEQRPVNRRAAETLALGPVGADPEERAQALRVLQAEKKTKV